MSTLIPLKSVSLTFEFSLLFLFFFIFIRVTSLEQCANLFFKWNIVFYYSSFYLTFLSLPSLYIQLKNTIENFIWKPINHHRPLWILLHWSKYSNFPVFIDKKINFDNLQMTSNSTKILQMTSNSSSPQILMTFKWPQILLKSFPDLFFLILSFDSAQKTFKSP